MRNVRRLVAVAAAVTAFSAPAFAAVPDLVTVRYNPPVDCVTTPCPQPLPVTVCVNVPADAPTCTPEDPIL